MTLWAAVRREDPFAVHAGASGSLGWARPSLRCDTRHTFARPARGTWTWGASIRRCTTQASPWDIFSKEAGTQAGKGSLVSTFPCQKHRTRACCAVHTLHVFLFVQARLYAWCLCCASAMGQWAQRTVLCGLPHAGCLDVECVASLVGKAPSPLAAAAADGDSLWRLLGRNSSDGFVCFPLLSLLSVVRCSWALRRSRRVSI